HVARVHEVRRVLNRPQRTRAVARVPVVASRRIHVVAATPTGWGAPRRRRGRAHRDRRATALAFRRGGDQCRAGGDARHEAAGAHRRGRVVIARPRHRTSGQYVAVRILGGRGQLSGLAWLDRSADRDTVTVATGAAVTVM